MIIPFEPYKAQGALFENPVIWCGNVAVDGTVQPWLGAPLGSIYIRFTAASVTLRIKTAAVGVSGDWLTMTAT